MFGLLNIDKPAGLTSRDVVNRVQRLVKPHKAGHAGTLDPLATGVLVVAVGQATRLIEYVQRMPKTYRAAFLFGKTSDTEDVEGIVRELPDAPMPAENQIRNLLPRFVGRIEQEPPAFSAIKVGGQRAYKLARRGEDFRLAPRAIEIFSIDLIRYQYPQLELLVRCGSGTYIRSLGRDIARALSTDAVMSVLTRQAIGPFRVEEAIAEVDLTLSTIEQRLLPPILALGEMPQVVVTPEEASRLWNGLPLAQTCSSAAPELAAVSPTGDLVAILISDAGRAWKPVKTFANPAAAQ